MNLKNEFKKIVIKDGQDNNQGEVTDVVVIKSSDDSVLIEKGTTCVIAGTNFDDTVQVVSIDNSFSIIDQDANTALISLLTTDTASTILAKIEDALSLNNLTVRVILLGVNTINARFNFYSTNNTSSSIELAGDVTLLSEVGHIVDTVYGVDDNSISLSVNGSGSGVIGEAEDGSYMDGAIGVYTPDILTPSTPIGHAVDWINEYLLALTPDDSGVSLHNSDLSLDGIVFETGYISSDLGSTINYQAPYIANTSSSRILTKSQISNIFRVITIAFKNADNGTLSVELNGSSLGVFDLETAFQEVDRNGNQNIGAGQYATSSSQELEFISVGVYDNFPNYQEAIVSTLTSNADTQLQNGFNTIKMIHTVGVDVRETNDFEFFFNDTVDSPIVNSGSIVVAKGSNITTRQMSGITLINGGNDDVSSPTFNNIAKFAHSENLFNVSGDVFATTNVPFNDSDLVGISSVIDWEDIIGFTTKAINIASNIKYYGTPSTVVTANNLVSSLNETLIDSDIWVVDTETVNNSSDTADNFNDESRRMYYGTPYLDAVNSITGNDITCTGADFTGMAGFYIENLSNSTFTRISSVSGDTVTLDSQIFSVGNDLKIYVTGSLMLLSDKNNFNSANTLVGRDYSYLANNDMTEAISLLGRITRPSINFSANHFPVGSPSYVSLDGRYGFYATYFITDGVRTGMKLVLEGLGSIANFQSFIQEIRVTIPFDDTVSGTSGYDGTSFNPSNISTAPALYRGLLYKTDGTGQYAGGNPIEGSGLRLGEPILNGSDIEMDFTTGTLNNLLASYHYFVEIIVRNDAPIFNLSNNLLTGLRLEER